MPTLFYGLRYGFDISNIFSSLKFRSDLSELTFAVHEDMLKDMLMLTENDKPCIFISERLAFNLFEHCNVLILYIVFYIQNNNSINMNMSMNMNTLPHKL